MTHGQFPRVIIHLNPDSLKLSPQCEAFFQRHGSDCFDEDKIDAVLQKFQDRFGNRRINSTWTKN